MRLAVAVVLSLALSTFCTSAARAEWWVQSPDDACIGREVLVEGLIAMVPQDKLAAGPKRTAHITLYPGEGRLTILVESRGVAIGERRVAAPDASCEELAEAAVFVLATLIEGDVGLEATTAELPTNEGATMLAPPERAETEPSEVADGTSMMAQAAQNAEQSAALETTEGSEFLDVPETRGELVRRSRPGQESESEPEVDAPARAAIDQALLLAIGGALRSGAEPNFGGGPRLSVSWRRRRLRLALHGAYFRRTLPVDTRELVINAGEIGVRGCAGTPRGALRVEGCLGVDVGIHAGRGLGFDVDERSVLTSIGIAGDVGLRYTFGAVFLRAMASAAGRVRQVRFTRRQGTSTREVFAQSAFSVGGHLELGFALGPGGR